RKCSEAYSPFFRGVCKHKYAQKERASASHVLQRVFACEQGAGPRYPLRLCAVHQFQVNHRCRIAAARAQLQDAGITARTLSVTSCELTEQLLDHILLLGRLLSAHEGSYLTARMQVAALRQSDQLFCDRTQFFCFRFRSLDAFMYKQVGYQVAK